MTIGLYQENLRNPRAYGYGARIDETWVRLARSAERQAQVSTDDALAQRRQESVLPNEQVLETGDAFVRSDLTGGEGLDRFPRTNPLAQREFDITRYWESRNVDFRRPDPGRPYTISLSEDVASWATVGDNVRQVSPAGGTLYVAAGQFVYRFNNYASVAPDGSFALGSEIDQLDTSEAGEGVALLLNGEVWYKPIGTENWIELPNTDGGLDDVKYVTLLKDRILVFARDPGKAAPGRLLELGLTMTGPPSAPTITCVPLRLDTFVGNVTCWVDVGIAILVGTSDGYLRAYVPRGNAGETPILTVMGKTFLNGEIPYGLGHHSGKLVILTRDLETVRLHTGTMLDERFGFIVGEMQLKREWPGAETNNNVCDRVAVLEDNMWFLIDHGHTSHLWRYDMVSTGVHNHADTHVAGCDNIVDWRSNIVFHAEGNELYHEGETYFDPGWVILPIITLGMNTKISWQSVFMQIDGIVEGGGTQAELWVSYDEPNAILNNLHPAWQLVLSASSAQEDRLRVELNADPSYAIALMIRLLPSPGGLSTVRITQVGVIGVSTERDWLLQLPVSISDQIEVPYRYPVTVPGYGNAVHEWLLTQSGKSVDARLLDPPVRVKGMVSRILEATNYITERGSQGVACTVEIKGKQVAWALSSEMVGDEATGMGLTGVALLGVGQSGGS